MSLLQPGGESDVIGMNMSDEHAPERLCREDVCGDRLPCLLAHRRRHTRIDDDATIVRIDEPHVDVIEIHRQRYPRPAHAGRDLDALA